MSGGEATSAASREEKLRRLEQLRREVAQLEAELAQPDSAAQGWPPKDFYLAYYATAGFVLGGIAAGASLLFNVVGAAAKGLHPLQLIRVYLTFPLGEKALQLESGIALAIGCCLYIATGMILGMVVHVVLAWDEYRSRQTSLARRLGLATVLGVAIWLVNYYALLSWLQPLLFGGNWIVREIPWWVAALTHLVFTWSLALLYPLGKFVPYQLSRETS